ncbi:MAG: phosphoglycerate kinase [Candidatus Aenigmarchaeota archaeon]|nr:phosphoglycerate kinase [Candidatus Aenigmarchaeota archaeon]
MLSGSIVFDKVDINVPTDNLGNITDTQKIDDAAKSISWCFLNGAHAVVVLSHQGRKKDESTRKHCDALRKYFQKVVFTKRHGEEAVKAIADSERGTIIVLENLRSDDEEKDYSVVTETNIYRTLKAVEEKTERKVIFVKDDFATSHRKDLCTYGLPMQLKKEGYHVIAGPLLREETENSRVTMEKLRDGNVVCIWGGKKFEDYLNIFRPFLEKYPNSIVLTSGPLSLLIHKAMGREIGENEKFFEIIPELLIEAVPLVRKFKGRILTPVDYYVSNHHGRTIVSSKAIEGVIYDIGPKTVELYTNIIRENPNSVILGNGPLGEYEKEENRKGTIEVYAEVFRNENKNFIIGGGGDFNAMMKLLKLRPDVMSNGGKAFLECVVKGSLPGLEPCQIEIAKTV